MIANDQDEHKVMIDGLPIRCTVLIREGVPGLQEQDLKLSGSNNISLLSPNGRRNVISFLLFYLISSR